MSIFNQKNSGNPFLRESIMQKTAIPSALAGQGSMTVRGAIDKSLLLFGIMMITTVVSFMNPSSLLMIAGAIGGLIAVIVAAIRPAWSPVLAPIYALLEGLFVGAVSAMYAAAFQGIVMHAVGLTISMLFLMLIIYRLELIRVTQKFRAGVFMATGAVAIVYLMSWVLGFFGINMPFLHEGGLMGIGISVVIIGIAAMNLLLDFDSFEKGQQYGAPKYMEWFSAMGLLITLVWLYIEFLRLLSKLQRD